MPKKSIFRETCSLITRIEETYRVPGLLDAKVVLLLLLPLEEVAEHEEGGEEEQPGPARTPAHQQQPGHCNTRMGENEDAKQEKCQKLVDSFNPFFTVTGRI
jgi:hypothetical protein